MLGRVLGRLHHDAAHRAGDGAELAADALLEAVGVAMQDVAATLARRNRLLPFRVLDGHDRLGVVLEGRRQGTGDVDGAEEDLAQRHQRVPWAATTTIAVAIIMASDSGNNDFQLSAIRRSYRIRGSVARSQT